MKRIAAGIDFGGTKIRTGIIDRQGALLGEMDERPTEADRPPEAIVADMAESVRTAVRSAGLETDALAGVGIGSPGPLALAKGLVLKAPNLTTLHGYPLRDRLSNLLDLPAHLNNDGNCFVLAEARFGAGKDANIVCGVTLGTGLGGGIVMNGKIFSGATGTAAEVWTNAYGGGIAEDYGAGRGVSLAHAAATGDQADAREVFELAEQGDERALASWRMYGGHLGKILSPIVNILDPDVVVLGGSVSAAWPYFEVSLLASLRKFICERPRQHVKVQPAKLGDVAGVLGAGALVFQEG